MTIDSPYYWLMVVGGAFVVSLLFLVGAGGDRERFRAFRLAALFGYIAACLVFVTYFFTTGLLYGIQVNPPLPWRKFPEAASLGVVTVFVGGHILAGLFRVSYMTRHPELRKQTKAMHVAASKLSEVELHDAEAYDAKWLAADRERIRTARARRSGKAHRWSRLLRRRAPSSR